MMVNALDKCYVVNRYSDIYADDWRPLEDMVRMTIHLFLFIQNLFPKCNREKNT